ncbi:MAG: T9SS type A sorting domain-containing protein, partial [Bacteroidota bacterium]|nr:T9SS type A sorting domain-containing protein [Bacteroidota bacterium]
GAGFDTILHINFYSGIMTITQGPNETYYVVGNFDRYNGQPVQPIVRLHNEYYGLEEQEPAPTLGELMVYPNPAGNHASFEWELPLLENEAYLRLTDLNGVIIKQITFTEKQGQWLWDTRKVKNGTYIFEIVSNGKQLANGKLVIQK